MIEDILIALHEAVANALVHSGSSTDITVRVVARASFRGCYPCAQGRANVGGREPNFGCEPQTARFAGTLPNR